MKYYLIESKPDDYNNRNVAIIASKKPIHRYVYSAKEIDKHEFYIFSKYFDEIVENEIMKEYHITLKEYFENVF